MNRREFIGLLGGAAAGWPLAARAQQGGPMRRVAVMMSYAEADPETTARLGALRLGLEKRGWVEGRNVRIDYRLGVASPQASSVAKEVIGLSPNVVLTNGPAQVVALQRESPTTPI